MWLLLLLQVCGAPLPPRPTLGLWDESQLLTEAETRSIRASLAQARRQGVELYVAIFPSLKQDTSLKSHAEALHQQWQAGEYGIVIAMEATTGECRIFAQPPEHDPAFTEAISRFLSEAAAHSEGLPTPGARLTAMVEYLAQRLFVNHPDSGSASPSLLGLHEWLILAGMGVAAMALIVFAWSSRKSPPPPPLPSDIPPLYFPEVTVGTRLGAPFGGGVVARLNFSPLPSQTPVSLSISSPQNSKKSS